MFQDREKAFEAKYKQDQDLRFRVNARRNKLFGLWAAARMGVAGADADAYAKEVVASDFEKPGDDDVIEKVQKDLAAKGINASAGELQAQLAKHFDEAKEQFGREASSSS